MEDVTDQQPLPPSPSTEQEKKAYDFTTESPVINREPPRVSKKQHPRPSGSFHHFPSVVTLPERAISHRPEKDKRLPYRCCNFYHPFVCLCSQLCPFRQPNLPTRSLGSMVWPAVGPPGACPGPRKGGGEVYFLTTLPPQNHTIHPIMSHNRPAERAS